jgi:hypothetical protein
VVFRVNPWAEVFWKGERLGTTPMSHPVLVPAGLQVFRLKNSELGVDRSVAVQVVAGKQTVLKEDLME